MDVFHQSCACQQVRFEAVGLPILAGVCYCDDCQAGGRMLEALGGAKAALEPDGGSDYLTYRDDRYRCVAGEGLLEGHKLRARSPTTRYVAGCCKTPMYLKYKRGHWVSTFRQAYQGGTPPVEMRTNLKWRDSALPFPDHAPRYQRFPMTLFAKLIRARFAMVLGR